MSLSEEEQFYSGYEAYKSGNISVAIEIFEKLSHEAKDIALRVKSKFLLGVSLLFRYDCSKNESDLRRAIAVFGEIYNYMKESPKFLYNYGYAHYLNGNMSEAINLWMRAVEINNNFIPALQGLSKVLYEANDPRAYEFAKRLYSISHDNIFALITLARICRARGDTTNATEFYHAIFDRYLSELHLEREREEQMREEIGLLYGFQISGVEKLRELAVEYAEYLLDIEQYDEARNIAALIIDEDRKNAKANYIMAYSIYMPNSIIMRSWDKGIDYIREKIMLYDDERSKALVSALRYINTALESSFDMRYKALKILILAEMRSFQQARELIRYQILDEPGLFNLLKAIILLLEESEDIEEIKDAFRIACEKNTGTLRTISYYLYSQFLVSTNDKKMIEIAITLLESLIMVDRFFAKAYPLLMTCYTLTGRYKEALMTEKKYNAITKMRLF